MKLRVNNTDIEPKRVRDRIEFSFDSGSGLDYVTLKGSDIFGDIQLSKIQLEQSTVSTPFVEPMESETVASGLFKSVQGISYEITSPDSDTWAQIKQSVEGSITTYHNGPLQSSLALTVNDVIFGIRDIVSGDQASFNLRLEGIQQVVKDEMFESVQTQLSNFVGIELQDVEGNINTIQNTVDGSVQKISDLEGSFNTMQDTVDGSIQRIGDVEGNLNTVQNTADSNVQAITSLSGRHNTTRNTVNSMSQVIGTEGEKIAQIVMNDSIFKVDVIDEINDAKSSVNVLSDSIGLRSSGNTIYIGGEGILIDAESIFLGDSTQIKDGIITNRLISAEANISGAKIADATIGNAKIITMDVGKISGNISEFIRSYWDAEYSSVAITGSTVGMIHSNNIRYNGYAFELRNNEVRIGVPTYIYDTLDMRANDIVFGRDMSISANTNPGNWLYIKGSSGNIAEFGGSVQIRVPFETHSTIQAGGTIAMNQNHIYFGDSANMYAPATDELQVNIRGNRRALFRNADISFWNTLNMRGYTITEQSDERLKRDITDTGIDSLEILKQTRFVGFNWIDEELNAETGRQMGVLAQDTPHLHIYDQENDEWSIDIGKQIMVNSHAIQQLTNRKDAEITELKERIEVLENE